MKRISSIIRWAARVLGALMALWILFMAMGDRLPDAMELGVDERLLFAALALMVLGALAAWKWELVGGLVVLLGFGMFWYLNGSYPGGYFTVFPLAGCFFLIAWLLDHRPDATPAA